MLDKVFLVDRLGVFKEFVDRGLCTIAEARSARWSAYRAENGAFYIVGITLFVASCAMRYLEHQSADARTVAMWAMPVFAFPPVFILFQRVWGPRYAHDRIQRQIAKLLPAIHEVDEVAIGSSTRCRVGHPARLQQHRVRALRSLLRRAVVGLPREITCLSGRGHQRGDFLVGDKVRSALLRALTDSPQPAKASAREDLRKLLAALSQAVLAPDPHEKLETALRGVPATCSPASEPLKTWSWRWYSLTTPILFSVLAIPLLSFVVAKLANSSAPAGLAAAGVATVLQTAAKYLQYRKGD
ncbi:hypothetical protein AB0878_46300 [Amycolatopsis sp. NPDC047767]|uniref:hypothetical protein n=1 Tax=Amycolatopsis sp. NPDC047767 TaxID=3156765 RepID=UPI003456856D